MDFGDKKWILEKKMDFGIFINTLRAMSFWKNGFFKEEKNETDAIFKMS